MAGVEPVDDVAVLGKARELDDAHARLMTAARLGDRPRVLRADLVHIGEDHDAPAAQVPLAIRSGPLACAER